MIATLAHYANGDQTKDAAHRMQRHISFLTICFGLQGSSASNNARQLSIKHSSVIGLDEKLATPPNDVGPSAPAIGLQTIGRRKHQSERARIACGVDSAHRVAILTCSPVQLTVLSSTPRN